MVDQAQRRTASLPKSALNALTCLEVSSRPGCLNHVTSQPCSSGDGKATGVAHGGRIAKGNSPDARGYNIRTWLLSFKQTAGA